MISIKTPEEIEIMAKGGKILAKIMKELKKAVRPGIATKELDKLAESLIFKYGGKCSFKGYGNYPCQIHTGNKNTDDHIDKCSNRSAINTDMGYKYNADDDICRYSN